MNQGNNNNLSPETYGSQGLLPRLPVPDIEETCAKFLEWVDPLLNEYELKQTKQAVAAFLKAGGDGEKLQKVLLDRAGQPECCNWLESFWDDMYLDFRPSMNNMSFGYVFNEQVEHPGQSALAARLIYATLQFKSLLDLEEVEVDLLRGTPLCMAQLKNLFCKTRIPRVERDEMRTLYSDKNPVAEPVRHIIVVCRGRFFSFNVLTESGAVVSPGKIEPALKGILEKTVRAAAGETVGVLTSLPRDEWAAARGKLFSCNEENFEIIETALFAVCLDDSEPDDISDVSRIMLHGDGRNRWYDKNFQYIVCRNGKAGILTEHTGLDGSTILKMLGFVLAHTDEAVMTRRFLHGRTEAMRSVSSESLAFVKAAASEELSSREKSDALLDAVKKHNERIKACQAGQGVERHLIGLMKLSNVTSFAVLKKEVRQFVFLIEESLLEMADIIERM